MANGDGLRITRRHGVFKNGKPLDGAWFSRWWYQAVLTEFMVATELNNASCVRGCDVRMYPVQFCACFRLTPNLLRAMNGVKSYERSGTSQNALDTRTREN